ncbi:MAG: T9SS type A sorting domain-containing protein [Bacteroidia bacterium]|nr:T9SS type A sorting domain-containing protein [Bacteroidia bacterium]
MKSKIICFVFSVISGAVFAQLPVVRDTITVLENGYVLKMPWGNGFNSANVSSIDLNRDGKKDLVIFDRNNSSSEGRFRCFINTGSTGANMYRADTYLSYLLPRAFSWAVFFDYDKDGREDLFTSGNSDVTVYRNITTPNGWPNFKLVKSPLMVDIGTTASPNLIPLFASVTGVPAIADVDNDGDLDMLTFSAFGTFLRQYKNMSREKNHLSDSLEFIIGDDCWGNVAETSCTVDFNLCTGNQRLATISGDPKHKELHAGSCLTCLDSDGDKDMDLIMGDVSCNYVQYVHNNGTSVTATFNDTTKIYPNYKTNNTTLIRMNSFPCTYYADGDGDGKEDLFASPNTTSGENFKSLWFYKNTSTTPTVNFQFVKNNFLQDEMIDVGQNSYPVVFDYNNDNLKDLLIGTYGYYLGNTLSARLTLYQNVGTATKPRYSLVSRDYAGLGSKPNISFAIPTTGDVDGDGDTDLLIGTSSGQVHWFENTAGVGATCNFSIFKNNPFTFTTSAAIAAPQLFDLDGDSKLDLLIGGKNGRVAFYKNVGTATVPAFSLVTNTLGNVDTKDDPNVFGYDGYAVPYFYREIGAVKLLVGSVTGRIFEYAVPSNPLLSYTLLNPAVNNLYEGGQSSLCYEDVNGDGKRDLFVGNASGGLTFFTSNSPLLGLKDLTPEQLSESITLFPNPASETLNISSSNFENSGVEITIKDLTGRIILSQPINHAQSQLSIAEFEKGVYLITFTYNNWNSSLAVTKKFIKN